MDGKKRCCDALLCPCFNIRNYRNGAERTIMKTLLLGAEEGLGAAQVLAQNHQVRLIVSIPFKKWNFYVVKVLKILINPLKKLIFLELIAFLKPQVFLLKRRCSLL